MSPKVGMTPVRREQIVRATVRCLARHGYPALTMKTVAREAGVSQGILHYYFRDKRDILTAALRAVTAAVDRRVAVAQARSTRDPLARLGALVRACLAVAVEEREVWIVFIEYWGRMMHDPELSAINAEVYARARTAIGGVVREGIRGGVFRRVGEAEAAAVILGLVDGVSLQITFDPQAFTTKAATRFCEDAIRRYLAP